MQIYLPNCKRQKESLSAFSLIELLTVLAILGLLMAVAIPVFKNPSNSARQASVEIIKAHLQQAKAHAISSGSATAVAIPVLASGKELGARAISIVEVTKNAGVYVPAVDAAGRQLLLQRWQVLPGSFYFLPASIIASPNPTILDSPDGMDLVVQGNIIRCHILVFGASGQIVLPNLEPQIAIAKAVNRGNSLTLTEKADNRPIHEIFRVNRLTGRTRRIETL